MTQFLLFPTCELSPSALLGEQPSAREDQDGGATAWRTWRFPARLMQPKPAAPPPPPRLFLRTKYPSRISNPAASFIREPESFSVCKKEDRESYDQPPLTREANSLSGRSATLKKKTNKHALALFSPAHVAQQLFPLIGAVDLRPVRPPTVRLMGPAFSKHRRTLGCREKLLAGPPGFSATWGAGEEKVEMRTRDLLWRGAYR